MRQTALVRLDGVGERDRLGALRALHLDVAPHFRKSGGPPAASARRDYAYPVLNTSATMSESTARLWRPWLRINRVLRVIPHMRWRAEAWSVVRIEFRRALALRSEIRRKLVQPRLTITRFLARVGASA